MNDESIQGQDRTKFTTEDTFLAHQDLVREHYATKKDVSDLEIKFLKYTVVLVGVSVGSVTSRIYLFLRLLSVLGGN